MPQLATLVERIIFSTWQSQNERNGKTVGMILVLKKLYCKKLHQIEPSLPMTQEGALTYAKEVHGDDMLLSDVIL